MSTSIRCFDYVNHPYDKVCETLTSHAKEVFHNATRSAETRAENVASGLHVKIAGVEFGKEILIDIKSLIDIERRNEKKSIIRLSWHAAQAERLFPTMHAELFIYPITATETQLDFRGEYDPPIGFVGKAIDKMVGHRIAEASVHHFVMEVADYLRKNISSAKSTV